jgi:hypothetical protein
MEEIDIIVNYPKTNESTFINNVYLFRSIKDEDGYTTIYYCYKNETRPEDIHVFRAITENLIVKPSEAPSKVYVSSVYDEYNKDKTWQKN